MSLVKTSLLNSVAVSTKVACALLLNKFLAVYVGPSGFASIGQFQNFLTILIALSGGIFATGLTKLTAQYYDDSERQYKAWQTAVRLSLYSITSLGLLLAACRNQLSEWVFMRLDMGDIFIWIPLALPALVASNLLMAIVNGKKEVKVYVLSNIISSILSLLLIAVLSYGFGLRGSLIAFILSPALALFATASLIVRRDWFNAWLLWGRLDQNSFIELRGLAGIGVASALLQPFTYIIVRDHISNLFGVTAAGYWQATWKISEVYLMLITASLALYFLPRLAEIRNSSQLKIEIAKVYSLSLPLAMASAAIIFLMRYKLIALLFTPDFNEIVNLLPWQLAGDIVKIGSWVLGYVLIGRSMVKSFIVLEIAFSLAFISFSWILLDKFALAGVAIAYFVSYSLYWAALALVVITRIEKIFKHKGA